MSHQRGEVVVLKITKRWIVLIKTFAIGIISLRVLMTQRVPLWVTKCGSVNANRLKEWRKIISSLQIADSRNNYEIKNWFEYDQQRGGSVNIK